jgi:hypothetical protein
VSAGLVPELGILYENGGPVALGVKGVVAAAIDGFGPLCDVVAANTMVAWIDDGKLGDDSPVVATVVGMEEFPEEVTTFVSIVV